MKLYAVKFDIDTGYEYEHHFLIYSANNQKEVADFLARYNKALPGEHFLVNEIIEEITVPKDTPSLVWNSDIFAPAGF